MTQALIEKENDPKVYCSVPKVITYLLHLYKSSFKPILPENFASHDTKKKCPPASFPPQILSKKKDFVFLKNECMDFKKNFSHTTIWMKNRCFLPPFLIFLLYSIIIYIKKTSNHYHQQQTNQKIHEFSWETIWCFHFQLSSFSREMDKELKFLNENAIHNF